MTVYRLLTHKKILPSNPLHVSHFYKLQRHHATVMSERQDLILFLAHLHDKTSKKRVPVGTRGFPIRLTSLRDWVYNYEIAFDYFFTVVKHGYKISNDDLELSYIVPKKIEWSPPTEIISSLVYSPPPLPDDGIVSKVFLQFKNRDLILQKLNESGRFDLLPQVEWLLNRQYSEINFYFEKAGKLQKRDTSTWPIAGIENWPSWLRTLLFGPGIDIDSAYVQFLLQQIKQSYVGREGVMKLIFPDLLEMLDNKNVWRNTLCVDTFKLPPNEENLNFIKKICMGIANGSKISTSILTGASEYSEIKNLIIEKLPQTGIEHLNLIGDRLTTISNQFLAAKKVICNAQLKLRASKNNQRQVFVNYFEWERLARYKIWEAVDYHGLMIHDGIDGIPQPYLEGIDDIIRELSLKLTTK